MTDTTLTVDKVVDFMYDQLPSIYHSYDTEQDLSLYRYMRSMFAGYDITDNGVTQHIDGAGETLLNVSNTFTDLIDPDKCPDKALTYLLSSFGLTYNPNIETRKDADGNPIVPSIYYHRKYIKYIGDFTRRLGTIAGIRFLIRVLTGFEFEYEYERRLSEDGTNYGRYLVLHLLVEDTEDEAGLEHSRQVIEQFLKPFVPFYITVAIGESRHYQKLDVYDFAMLPTSTYSVDYYLKERDGKTNG